MSLTLSKSETLAIRSSLVPNSPFYDAFSTAIQKNEVTITLQNGVEVLIREDENLTRTNSSQCDPQREITALIKKAKVLEIFFSSVTQEKLLKTCEEMHFHIQNLIYFTGFQSTALSSKIYLVESELIRTREQHLIFCQRKRELIFRLTQIEVVLGNLAVKEGSTKTEIDELSQAIENLEAEIKKEKIKRMDAITDSIPIVGQVIGVVGGLVTRRYTRMIPFYSGISGLVSLITQKKEVLEYRLENKRKELEELKRQKGAANKSKNEINLILKPLDSDISRLEREMPSQDLESKRLGKELTDLGNAQISLQLLLKNYDFLTMDVEQVQKRINRNKLNPNLIANLISDLENTKHSILAINC